MEPTETPLSRDKSQESTLTPDINAEKIGRRLREERTRLDRGQNFLSDACAVNPRTISAWETGHQFPNAEALAAMFHVGIDVLYVVTGQRILESPTEGHAASSFLSPGERALLANYRRADADGRQAAERVIHALAETKWPPGRAGGVD